MRGLRAERTILGTCAGLCAYDGAEIYDIAFEVAADLIGGGQQVKNVFARSVEDLKRFTMSERLALYHAVREIVE
jgi:hypothetical protein